MTYQANECDEQGSYNRKYQKNLENKLDRKYYLGILKQEKRAKVHGIDYDPFHQFQENIFNFKKNSNGEVDYERCLDAVIQSVTNQIKYKYFMDKEG